MDFKDDTRDRIFPYMNDDFNGIKFIEKQDNFTKIKDIKSSLIFKQDNLNTDSPLFTIAIPTYNRLDTLKEAIESAINQDIDMGGGNLDSKKSYEIIVVENCNDINITTDTQIFLENNYKGQLSYYKNHKNIGLFGNWNRCIELAKGKWVCLLHDDDILFDNYLSEMKYVLNEVKNIAVISSHAIMFRENTSNVEIKNHINTNNNSIKDYILNPIRKKYDFNYKDCYTLPITSPSARLHNKILFLQSGGYNQDFYPMDDVFAMVRIINLFGHIHYKKITNAKRLDISQGATKDLFKHYLLQNYYFIRDCIKFNDRYKKILYKNLLENIMETNNHKEILNNFYRDKNINTILSYYDKCIILITNLRIKLSTIFKNSRLLFSYKKFIKDKNDL